MPRKVKNPKLKQKQKQSQHVTVKVVNNIGTKRGKKGGKRKRIGSSSGGGGMSSSPPVHFYQPLSVMPQLPSAFEPTPHTPAFKAEDFSQQLTTGIRDGFMNLAREAQEHQRQNQPPATTSVPTAASAPISSRRKRTEPHNIFPDNTDVPLKEEQPSIPIRQERTDEIPPPTSHNERLHQFEEPPAAAAEYEDDALKQSAHPKKDEYSKFTTARALQRAKDYMALGGDRSLNDLAIDGTDVGNRRRGGNSGRGRGRGSGSGRGRGKDVDKPRFK